MNAFVLRRIITHWILDRDIARFEAEIETVLRAAERRARERRAADLEAFRALGGGPGAYAESGDDTALDV